MRSRNSLRSAVLTAAVIAARATAAQLQEPLVSGTIEDLTPTGIAFVETVVERDGVLLGAPFSLRLRFGIERAFLEEKLVQLFQRPLDVPVQIQAPWLAALDGARALESASSTGVRVALGEDIVDALALGEERRDERDYRVFELACTYVASRPGEFVLDAPRMRFAFASRFEDDFLQGRRPLDRRDGEVRGREARFSALPPPEAGRPPEFTGAIGRFALRVSAEPLELTAGDGLTLNVVVEALGELDDLSQCEPPRLDDLRGFHVRGSLVEREARRLTVRYELVAEDPEVRAIPAIAFASFDTTPPAGYRRVSSDPIPITVHPRGAAPAAPEVEGAERGSGPPVGTVALVVALVVLAAAAASVLRARRAR